MNENVNTEVIEKNEEPVVVIPDDNIRYKTNSTNEIEFFGSEEQVTAMFADWTAFIGEISNPANIATNPFLKNKYATLDEVLNTARPVLSAHNLGFMQSPTYDNKRVSVRTIVVHKNGGMIVFPALTLPAKADSAQDIIAACTYARRGALNPIMGMHGEEDDDGNTASGTDKPESTNKKNSGLADARKSVVAMCAQMVDSGVSRELIYEIIQKKCGSNDPRDLKTVGDCTAVKKELAKLASN